MVDCGTLKGLWGVVLLALAAVAARAGADVVDISPDGRQVAYVWSREAVVGGIEGGATVARAGDGARYVKWSPTGRQLALVTNSGTRDELKLYNPAAKTTRGIGGNLRAPFAWREDGNRFACVHDVEGKGAELVWYNLAENGVSFRVALPFAVDPDAPMVWLPATDDVALVASDHNVYTVEAGEVKKTTTSGDVLGLALYAGGKKLAWARRGPNLRYILMSVYAYDLTARNVVRLGFPERVAPLNPNPRTAPVSVDRVVFSPGGSSLLLFATLAAQKGRFRALYAVSMDGRSAREIQRVPIAEAEGLHGAWAPDGRSIAVLVSTPALQKLFVTAADGSGGRVIRSEGRP